MQNQKPRVLFFAPILEYPPRGGPQLSVINAIKVLSALSDLTVMTSVPSAQLEKTAVMPFLEQREVKLFFAPSSRMHIGSEPASRLLRWAKRLFAPLLGALDARAYRKLGKKQSTDIYWIDRVIEHAYYVFKSFRALDAGAALVGDTEAVYSRFVLRELPYICNPIRRIWVTYLGARKKKQEECMVQSASAVTAVSDIDVEYFQSISSDPSRIKLFSNVIDLDDYKLNGENNDKTQAKLIVLPGSYGQVNSPMDRAAKWMVEDIMPLVWQSVPDATLLIIGRNADKTQSERKTSKIEVVGAVDFMQPYLERASLLVVPLRHESGTRFKIVEGGAAGLPCVSTSLGAEGLEVEHGKNILIADDPEGFAQAVIDVLSDSRLAESLGSELTALIQSNYSIDTQTKQGKAIIDFLTNRRITNG